MKNYYKYPQIPQYINDSTLSSLCLACDHACGSSSCIWSSSLKPRDDWNAISHTLAENERKTHTYQVISCPGFELSQDFYLTEADYIRMIVDYLGISLTSFYRTIKVYPGLLSSVLEEYNSLYPRNIKVDLATRKEGLKKIYDKYHKYYKKNKKNSRQVTE